MLFLMERTIKFIHVLKVLEEYPPVLFFYFFFKFFVQAYITFVENQSPIGEPSFLYVGKENE